MQWTLPGLLLLSLLSAASPRARATPPAPVADDPAAEPTVEPAADPVDGTAEPATVESEAEAALRADWERRITGQMKFFWKSAVSGTPSRAIPVGRHWVDVALSVDAEGAVVDAAVAGSSGATVLDGLAVDAIREASPLPEPPAELLDEAGHCVVPAWRFTLEIPPDRSKTLADLLQTWDYGADDGLGIQPLRGIEAPDYRGTNPSPAQ